ncbi:hypothetical protein WICANDRAFT_66133 [Wickerhamomyces anomalus NRRL Y-366-8]|uniref:Mitochondrial group I intron splicing factor CCM1 n=1 Tax=Wickerhamomyces anomalus (strain ATCC 58044 / CBS 1984 / NCYC 433 / NRRL Y-366-8) TaxID=683960 RepID=A0A1E3PA78_WICAA|nr:uncharacterized protein WICANDRAFT_66133 [Wickerhamomyces anomalus NRRL Y-366-8]ODQ61787.1 hypothetical protein WICANDRAFT_66133 [Wickerhamomyces anomalus NRRL Y-366-8]
MITSFKSLSRAGTSNIRLFSTSSCSRGKIRKFLKLAARDDIYIKPTSNFEHHQKKARKVKAGEERTAADLRKQKAATILQKVYNEDVDHKKLGPTSNEDLKYFQHADRKTLYTLLGVTEDQILDSVVVTKSVRAFLKRDQTEKAMTLAKLAQSKGIVSMNFIVAYFVQQGKINAALDLHTMRKKWNVSLNEQSMTMLFDEISAYRPVDDQQPLTDAQAKRVLEIYLASTRKSDYKPNLIHFNTCISALFRANDQSHAMNLFKQMEDINIRPDVKTYTIVLQGLAHAKNDIWAVVNAIDIFPKLLTFPEHKLDNHVLEALVRVFTNREKLYLIKRGIQIAQSCFQIPDGVPKIDNFKRLAPSQKGEKLQIPDVFTIENKIEPTASLIDTIMLAASKIGDDKLAIKFFETFKEEGYTSSIDRALVHRYLTVSQLEDKKNAGENSIKIYKTFTQSDLFRHIKLNDQTKYIVFNGLARQVNSTYEEKKQSLRNNKKANDALGFVEEFMEMVEKPYSLRVFSGYLKAVHKLSSSGKRTSMVKERLQVMRKYVSGKSFKDLNCTKPELDAFIKHLNEVEKRFPREPKTDKMITITGNDLTATQTS